jgi:hypothetical protein
VPLAWSHAQHVASGLGTVHSPEQEMRALQGLPQRYHHVLGWQCSAEGSGQERRVEQEVDIVHQRDALWRGRVFSSVRAAL